MPCSKGRGAVFLEAFRDQNFFHFMASLSTETFWSSLPPELLHPVSRWDKKRAWKIGWEVWWTCVYSGQSYHMTPQPCKEGLKSMCPTHKGKWFCVKPATLLHVFWRTWDPSSKKGKKGEQGEGDMFCPPTSIWKKARERALKEDRQETS